MSYPKTAILLGTALILMPGHNALAHGTESHRAAAAEATGSTQDADTEIVVTIDPDASAAEVVRVNQGAHVHLTVLGAGANEMHLHGYDIEIKGEPDQPAMVTFEATHTGRFPLQMHIEDDLLGSGEKAVLYIEVRGQ
jgi:hypothetical protein